ncbi:MAG: hypothetical protein P8P74_18055 [Crocinitomicaceae bacterium]|nr:hypothetical protein [Crocinitomicaceae bacterium]
MKLIYSILLLLIPVNVLFAQAVPSPEENIPYLVTFGGDGEKSWGDDDFCQVFFFVVPKTQKTSVYFRVYDPGTGEGIDEKKGGFNTKTKFTVFGGKGCITNKDARGTDPRGKWFSGNILSYKTFGNENTGEWYTFGPFNPTSGEYSKKYGGYVFKLSARGVSGDDGNLYKYFMSTSSTTNSAVEGGNAFTFEYTFRLNDAAGEVSHIYPYIDSNVISVKQGNFDWDNDGEMKIITNTRLTIPLKKSGDGDWQKSEHKVLKGEKESTFDVQFHKNKSAPAKNNNVSFYITNQYGESMPFYTVPIGGVPKPKSVIRITKKK